jgi:phage anti-repressor protein
VRKPHLDPCNPEAHELYALTKYRTENYPEWVKERLQQGFSVEDLHFKNHAAAMRRVLGQEPLYDSTERYHALLAKEAVPFRR